MNISFDLDNTLIPYSDEFETDANKKVASKEVGEAKLKEKEVLREQRERELEEKLKKEGWQVRKSKVDGGCYEVYGTTPEGARVEAYFHPVTLEKPYVAQRGKLLFRKKGY